MPNKQVRLKQVEGSEILYHYTKSNGVNGIIHNNSFWATKSDFLNDPNEFNHIYNIITSICDEVISNKNWKKMFLDDVLEEQAITSGGNKDYFVLSFSNRRDSITMWSEFGSRTGYNIGFKSKQIIERILEDNKIDYHGFVIYNSEEQKRIVKRILSSGLSEEMNMTFSEILELGARDRNDEVYKKACRKFQKMTAVYAMFFKNEAFREEQEYRFVFKKQRDTEVLFREKDGFMIPYIKIQLSKEPLPVKEIVVAPQNHIDLAKKGMEYMMLQKGYEVEVSLSNIKLRY
ncbi:MAG: DUF2971 domain-containing protein [Lachnospira sp.]|nr:DUF2971 domain-containing protein [Lachnospira sp.]